MGEFDFINWVRAQQRTSDLVQLAAGDDLAILKWKPDDLLLVGCDQVLDEVHFDSNIHLARAIGKKAMNRNLSDCAAMACLPAAALMSVALPRRRDIEYAKELYLGVKEAADKFHCPIVGGETGSWDGKLAVTVTIFGRSAATKPVLRSGSKPGDLIYVTGSLGGSLLIDRHMDFTPRIAEALVVAQTGLVTSMIDLSDGLSSDLRHICSQSGVGAVIRAADLPIHVDAIALSGRDGRTSIDHALHDGEDYELLFTLSRAAPLGHLATRVGRITAEPGIWLELDGKREPLQPKGWEHRF